MTDTVVDREALGRARDFMRRADAEFDVCNKNFDVVLQPIVSRLKRFPGRKLRPDNVDTVATDWLRHFPQRFCLHLSFVKPKPTQLEIFEIRVAPTTLRNDDWPNVEDGEINLAISNEIITLGIKGMPFQSTVISHIVSLHGLYRRYQRCSERDDDSVLRDLKCLLGVQPDEKLDGLPCAIPTSSGEWRGMHKVLVVGKHKPAAVIMLRTFI